RSSGCAFADTVKIRVATTTLRRPIVSPKLGSRLLLFHKRLGPTLGNPTYLMSLQCIGGRPPPEGGSGWESESLRVFNTRQESGNGTRELRTGPDLCLNMGPAIREWVPL